MFDYIPLFSRDFKKNLAEEQKEKIKKTVVFVSVEIFIVKFNAFYRKIKRTTVFFAKKYFFFVKIELFYTNFYGFSSVVNKKLENKINLCYLIFCKGKSPGKQ